MTCLTKIRLRKATTITDMYAALDLGQRTIRAVLKRQDSNSDILIDRVKVCQISKYNTTCFKNFLVEFHSHYSSSKAEANTNTVNTL